MRKTLAAAVMAALLLALMLPLGAGDAQALQETYAFTGSGWGHGVGMCQYGARGMAAAGFDYVQILTYYYQGTQVGGWSCPPSIRVGLLDGQSAINLAAESGSFAFFTSDGDVPGAVMTPGGTWTVAADAAGAFYILRPDGSRVNDASYGSASKPLYVRGAGDGDVLRLPQNGNHGVSHLSAITPLELDLYASSGSYALRAVLISWFETYLRGIAEVPGGWPLEAVKAQAVAARSYAVRGMGKHAASGYDLCDDVHCQYYKGSDQEKDTGWVQAVDATAGQVLVYGGGVAQCFYSASCGGHTDNNEDVWFGSPVAYLRGVPCPWCEDPGNNPFASWTVTYSRAEMEARLNYRSGTYVGTLYGMDLSDRTPSGRVRYAYFTGSAGTVRVSGEQLRGYLNLRSSMVNLGSDGFDEYILLANPGPETAAAKVRLHSARGEETEVAVELPPMSRRTVHADDHFRAEEISAEVTSDRGIVAERAMYFDYLGEYDGGSCEHGATAAAMEWNLAEGYTAQGFDTWVLVYNPGGEAAHVVMDLLRDDGHTGRVEMDVAARSRATLYVDGVPGFEACALAAKVGSDKPVVVERAMYFDSYGRGGGHVALGATSLSSTWLFAEGYTGGAFDTWLLVGNPHDAAARVRFDLYVPGGEGGRKVEVEVPPHSRYTLSADQYLPGAEVAARVESDLPVVAERAMYFDYMGRRGGSCALGAAAGAGKWYLAEGYTAGGFDTYVLVGNASGEPARVKVSFLTNGGLAKEIFCDLAPLSRFTLNVDAHFPEAEISAIVEETSGRPVVVERAMYFYHLGRLGGHAALGMPQTSTTWLFAEGYTGS
ncbi:MAG: SpoIID/LytB domain-containing protein [Actinomycetota bacterium]